MATIITLEVPAQPGKGDELVAAFNKILPDTRAYKGCQSVTVLQRADDKDKIVLVETWDSEEDHNAYSVWRRDSGTLGDIMGLAAGRPVNTVYNDVS
ncbi:putative quinol monooxygenase [Pseudonocardia spinosispora]|uniref:putative quinol monooxygenase n=1 Tax=Pseudonocardia spinosispora TaxID=103441 RepID=UPI000416D524|nr:antibiotic biosynthesis monooxygenase family protein [Pseudonocardia spinosispora]